MKQFGLKDEMGNAHQALHGSVSIKMYDKFRLSLRIETTVAKVSFFKHYRELEHKNGSRSMAWAEMKKTIKDDKAGTDKLNKIGRH